MLVCEPGLDHCRRSVAAAPGRVPLRSDLRQRDEANGNAKHYSPALRIRQLFGQFASFLCSCSPVFDVVNSMRHDRNSKHNDVGTISPNPGLLETERALRDEPSGAGILGVGAGLSRQC
jgi:hypothetical protein